MNYVDAKGLTLVEEFEQQLDDSYCDFDNYDKNKHNLIDYLKTVDIYKYLLEEVRIKKTCEINKEKTIFYKFYYVYNFNFLNRSEIPEKILKIILKLNFNNFSL